MRWSGVALICAGCLAQPKQPSGSSGGAVVYRQVFSQTHLAQPAMTFVFTPMAGDGAVVALLGCTAPTVASFQLSAPGWSFVSLAQPVQVGNQAAQPFGAVIPSGNTVTITASSAGCTDLTVIGDEFGGTSETPFDATAVADGIGACDVATTTRHAGDAVWAACLSSGASVPVDPFLPGADDSAGNVTEYRLTNDPAGALEHSAFQNGVSYVAALVALAPP